jgi:O-acetyl-ADP-ribose deacetylase (regulator of RNase III)
MLMVKVVLVDINPKMIAAWKETFEENPEVEIIQGSMLDVHVSAWVTPTNSGARMDGGLDAVIRNFQGTSVQSRVQQEVKKLHGGKMPVGYATCVPTPKNPPNYLISTPTMVSSSENIADTMNVALACAAAFQAVHIQNDKIPGSVRSVAMPGLGAATGRTPVEICADLMWTAYDLFRERSFSDFGEMRKALEEILGDLGPATTKGQAKVAAGTMAVKSGWGAPVKPLPPEKEEDIDFDDFEDDDDE